MAEKLCELNKKGGGGGGSVPNQRSYYVDSYSGGPTSCTLRGHVTENGETIQTITANNYYTVVDDDFVKWFYNSNSQSWQILKKGTDNSGYGTSGYVPQSTQNGILSTWGYGSTLGSSRRCTVFENIDLVL